MSAIQMESAKYNQHNFKSFIYLLTNQFFGKRVLELEKETASASATKATAVSSALNALPAFTNPTGTRRRYSAHNVTKPAKIRALRPDLKAVSLAVKDGSWTLNWAATI